MQIEKPSRKQLLQLMLATAGTLAVVVALSNLSVTEPYSARNHADAEGNSVVEQADRTDSPQAFSVEDFIVSDDGLLNRGGGLDAGLQRDPDESNNEPTELSEESPVVYPETESFGAVYTDRKSVE